MGIALVTLAALAWLGVEAWRYKRLSQQVQDVPVAWLLSALDDLPGCSPRAKGQINGDGLTGWESGPIHVDALDSAGWVGLGLSPKQAASAIRYRNAVGGFRSPEVLGRMRVLPDQWMHRHWERLVFPPASGGMAGPATTSQSLDTRSASGSPSVDDPPSGKKGKGLQQDRASLATAASNGPASHRVDLNAADSLELLAIRGVGPWVAGRILQARRTWGGFVSVEQLPQALGWDSLGRALIPSFACSASDARPRCPDTLTVSQWQELPVIGWREAEVLTRYVRHHGGGMAELRRSGVMDSIEWDLLEHYLRPCGADLLIVPEIEGQSGRNELPGKRDD